MSNADASFNLTSQNTQDGVRGRDAFEKDAIEAVLPPKASGACHPLLHLVTGMANEFVLDVIALRGVAARNGNQPIFPMVLTLELTVGGRKILGNEPVMRRKIRLVSETEFRTGRIFSYQGPTFFQLLLSGRCDAAVAGVAQPGRGEGNFEALVSWRPAGQGEVVVAGNAVG